jgi:hypothetical protein
MAQTAQKSYVSTLFQQARFSAAGEPGQRELAGSPRSGEAGRAQSLIQLTTGECAIGCPEAKNESDSKSHQSEESSSIGSVSTSPVFPKGSVSTFYRLVYLLPPSDGKEGTRLWHSRTFAKWDPTPFNVSLLFSPSSHLGICPDRHALDL